MGNNFSQFFPPAPKFTESTLPNLHDKVYIVTGANTGVGQELAGLLYSRNATVYVAARSREKAETAIKWMQDKYPSSNGTLHFLRLDLGDLEGIKDSAQEFLSKEKRLDVLFNNAGVMTPPKGSTTKQGYELQLGTNCLGPFLFTKFLTPLLVQTARASPAGAVRVIWVSSSAAYLFAPQGGVEIQHLGYKEDKSDRYKYGVSKGGNVLHAMEYQRRFGGDGIVSVALNPGNLSSSLQRHIPCYQVLLISLILYPAVNGAYTELFAGLSPDAQALQPGQWVIPFGRMSTLRPDYLLAGKTVEQGGTGNAERFWEWSEEQVGRFA